MSEETVRYIARDVSWLSFNYRVLKEAMDERVPLLERLRFVAIYSSNLDEFFRVRVAAVRNLIRIGKKKINKSVAIKPKKVLKAITAEVNEQLSLYGEALSEIMQALEREGLFFYKGQPLTPAQQSEIQSYFRTRVVPFLQPYVEGSSAGEPFLDNQALYFSVHLKDLETSDSHYAFLNIPSDKLPRFYSFKEDGTHLFIMLDDVMRLNIDRIFPGYEVLECRAVKLNKDADLNIEDEYSGDLVEKIKQQIEKRNLGISARFLYDSDTSDAMLDWLVNRLGLEEDDPIAGGRAHNLNDYFQIPNVMGSHVEYPSFATLDHPLLKDQPAILNAVEQRDYLLHFPYQNYDYVLQFFSEAAIHPEVTDISAAFYRMAANSLIGEALVSAAKNGKQVVVFMEVKARFDEENNLKWAQRFISAGVKVVYSIPGLKVHAKIALVTKKKPSGKKQRIAFFGTGNLNEKTAKIYVDHGLLTADDTMTSELDRVFNYLCEREQPQAFEKLLVSQFNMVDRFVELIDYEIEAAKRGETSAITIKLNNLEERAMIEKLYEASQAGVHIRMIVRGICCLRPGVKGMSENITVKRIVDRFLEHARIFIFHHGGEEAIYLGSADWMNRNLHSRIEVSFPVEDELAREEIKKIVHYQWHDNSRAVELDQDVNNVFPEKGTQPEIRAQFAIYDWLREQ